MHQASVITSPSPTVHIHLKEVSTRSTWYVSAVHVLWGMDADMTLYVCYLACMCVNVGETYPLRFTVKVCVLTPKA